MATKKTDTKKTTAKAAPKKAPAKKAAPKAKAPKAEMKALPRHPRVRVTTKHESKAALAKSLAPALARKDEDATALAERLTTASNQQLLRLHGVVAKVKEKYGDRAKLIAKLGELQHKSKDKDYLAKLESLPLPQLLDLATSTERAARA